MVVSSTYRRFERDMADLMRVLRGTPAQILWRSYAPTHFGGESGAYVSGEDYEVRGILLSISDATLSSKIKRPTKIPLQLQAG